MPRESDTLDLSPAERLADEVCILGDDLSVRLAGLTEREQALFLPALRRVRDELQRLLGGPLPARKRTRKER